MSIFLLVAALAVSTVSSFTGVVPLVTPPRTTINFSPISWPQNGATTMIRKADLSRASTAASSSEGENKIATRVIRQIEREEEKMTKKREEARERLSKVEASLNQLQSKKQQYLNGIKLAQIPAGGNFSETTARSAVKALMWRFIAGSVTFITSLRFSGSIATALSIVGSDFLSKAFTMFVGERLMNKSQAGRSEGSDGAGRSLMKALIWRLFAICNTLTMAIFIAKDISIASKIAGSDAIFKTALMFVYERAWAKIEWGKEYQMEYNL